MSSALDGFSVIICTYCLFPEDISSEGIVNGNWFEILDQAQISCGVLSGSITTKMNGIHSIQLAKNKGLAILFQFSTVPSTSFRGILFRMVNKAFLTINHGPYKIHLNEYIWLKWQKKQLNSLIERNENQVVWVRILPSFPLLLILEQWKIKRFPFIVNINDTPEGHFENGISFEENLLMQTSNKAQCWTFPCKSLAETISVKYGLDSNRCFVIPHAMKEQETLYKRNVSSGKLKFVYAGTFYQSAFTDAFGAELKKAFLSGSIDNIDFIFILSQFDQNALDWITSNIPTAKIHKKISREEVFKISAEADCMIVADSIKHKNLLKGKLIEAISQGLPIFAVTYQGSVMDKVVCEYGAVAAYQDQESDISSKLAALAANLNNESWLGNFYIEREKVLAKVSPRQITKASIEIAQFANDLFLFSEGRTMEEPKPPLHFDWP